MPTYLPEADRFVGRVDERARLRGAVTDLLAGHGALVLVSGEPGIGKTSLAEVALVVARAAGAAVGIGRCYEHGVAPPFSPWPDLLASLAGETDIDTTSLPPPFGDGEPGQTAYQVLRALVGTLQAAARRQPLALLLDDLQWAEQEALDLLDLLTRTLEGAPILVFITYRDDEDQRGQPLHQSLPQLQRNRRSLSIALSPLVPSEIVALVDGRIGAATPELAASLQSRTEGNPLFLVSMLDEMIARQQLTRDATARWQAPDEALALPNLLRQIIEQRLARLTGDAASLLEVAAVIGVEWDLWLVESVLGWPEAQLLRALDDSLAAGLVAFELGVGEKYRFRHGLLRDLLYERQLARRRLQWHVRVVAALEALPESRANADTAAMLAYHVAAAEDWPRLARYALLAGDAARDRLATHTAVRFYDQALGSVERLPPDQRPWSPTEPAERLGQMLIVLGRHHAADLAFDRMVTAAHAEHDADAEVRAWCWQSWIARREYRLVEARLLAEQALVRARALGSGRLLALAHWNLGHLEKIKGETTAAVAHLDEAAQAARAAGEDDLVGWSLQHLAHLAVWRGDYALAERQAAEALALARTRRNPLDVAGSAWVLGSAQGERGHYAAALRSLRLGLDMADVSGERHYLARLLNTVGWLHAELADFATARHWDERSLAAARDRSDDAVSEAERYALLNLATDALGLGELALSDQYVDTFTRHLDDSEYARLRYLNRYQLLRAELALARNDGGAALRLAEEATRLASAKGVRKNLAKGWLLTGRALLTLDRPRDAIERLRRAIALADDLDHGSLRWQVRRWGSLALTTLGQSRDAATLALEAEALIDAIAIGLPEATMRAAFVESDDVRAVRLAVAATPAAASYPAGLSAREVEVLRLVAQGETSQAIADTLSISIKTVNTHLTSIFNKTGCANRAAATNYALRHGLA